jgi:hypothetical protein
MHRPFRLAAAALVVAACSNAGSGRVLSIPGVGQVNGQVFFDGNGDGAFGGLPDSGFRNVSVKLVATGTTDTVARAVSAPNGTFTFNGITVGNYTVVVDTTTIVGIDLHLTGITVGSLRTSALAIAPNTPVPVAVAISYRQVSLSQARSLSLGTQVFVVGVALANTGLFGDSILNLADSSGALRITSVPHLAPPATGDSIRVLGDRGTRDNQPVLIFANFFPIISFRQTPVDTLTATQAVNAHGGVADAALVTIADTVLVTDTSTQAGYRRMHVVDTVSPAETLEVRIDSLVFFPYPAKDVVGARLQMSGLLLPTATAGVWMLKPRIAADQRP